MSGDFLVNMAKSMPIDHARFVVERMLKMASEDETVADIVKELRGIKGGQHTNGGLSFERWRARCQFADEYADRFEAAHGREVAELRRRLEAVVESRKTTCGLCPSSERIKELRKCLMEACRCRCGKCNVGNPETESHFCGNFCDTIKRWRKALEGAKDEGK